MMEEDVLTAIAAINVEDGLGSTVVVEGTICSVGTSIGRTISKF